MTVLDQLTIALWRGHAAKLTAQIHGAAQAEAATFDDATFAKQYPLMKAAWRAAAIAMLTEFGNLTGVDVRAIVTQADDPNPSSDPKDEAAQLKADNRDKFKLPQGTSIS